MTLKTRQPTGETPWPLLLVEGPEKAGKSWLAAEFTGDERTGQAYWIDLAEGAADEYAAVPGADYLVVDHDGTWRDIVGAVAEIRSIAARSEKPVVLVIDSMTAEWDLLKDWVTARARTSPSGRRQLQKDPDAEIKPAMNFWNDANDRHRQLMRMLMSFPGVVVMTARGKEVAALDDAGKPTGATDYKVEGHKSLAFDASVWVRLSRDRRPMIVGARSVRQGVRPGVDETRALPEDFGLAWLVFDALGCGQGSVPRAVTALEGDESLSPLALAKKALYAACAAAGIDPAELAAWAIRPDALSVKLGVCEDAKVFSDLAARVESEGRALLAPPAEPTPDEAKAAVQGELGGTEVPA